MSFLFCWYLRESFNSFPFQSHLKQLWYGHHPRSLLTLSWLGAFCTWALLHIHKHSLIKWRHSHSTLKGTVEMRTLTSVLRAANQTKMFKKVRFFFSFVQLGFCIYGIKAEVCDFCTTSVIKWNSFSKTLPSSAIGYIKLIAPPQTHAIGCAVARPVKSFHRASETWCLRFLVKLA